MGFRELATGRNVGGSVVALEQLRTTGLVASMRNLEVAAWHLNVSVLGFPVPCYEPLEQIAPFKEPYGRERASTLRLVGAQTSKIQHTSLSHRPFQKHTLLPITPLNRKNRTKNACLRTVPHGNRKLQPEASTPTPKSVHSLHVA